MNEQPKPYQHVHASRMISAQVWTNAHCPLDIKVITGKCTGLSGLKLYLYSSITNTIKEQIKAVYIIGDNK